MARYPKQSAPASLDEASASEVENVNQESSVEDSQENTKEVSENESIEQNNNDSVEEQASEQLVIEPEATPSDSEIQPEASSVVSTSEDESNVEQSSVHEGDSEVNNSVVNNPSKDSESSDSVDTVSPSDAEPTKVVEKPLSESLLDKSEATIKEVAKDAVNKVEDVIEDAEVSFAESKLGQALLSRRSHSNVTGTSSIHDELMRRKGKSKSVITDVFSAIKDRKLNR